MTRTWLLWICSLLVAGLTCFAALSARAQEDIDNRASTAWWTYSGLSYADVGARAKSLDGRLTSLKFDPASNSYTGVYVANTGSYAKTWWWYAGVDAATLGRDLTVNKARLTSLQAYDTGGGVRFTAVMVANAGADAKTWWWVYDKSEAEILDLAKTNHARVTALQSYASGGHTVYSAIMVAAAGADAKPAIVLPDATTDTINTALAHNKVRLIDVTSAGGGRFNAVMAGCGAECPAWSWFYGLGPYDVLDKADDGAARVVTSDGYPGCGGQCFAVTMVANAPADVTACDPQGCISEAKLLASICGKLDGHVVGYACRVGALAPKWGGVARTSANPPAQGYTPNRLTDIASVSKTMTAIAVLQLLAADSLSVDTPIGPYIYKDWPRASSVDKLTFRNLLTHSTGFTQNAFTDCGNNIDYAGVKTVVYQGSYPDHSPAYGNCNFALLRELMPALMKQRLEGLSDGPVRAARSSQMYRDYVNAHVFQPVGVPGSSCTPDHDPVWFYTFPAGGPGANNGGDWKLKCGSGGWVLSANQIFRVVSHLATDTTLLSAGERQKMFAGCLGWDCSVRPDCPSPNDVCKNGDLRNGPPTTVALWTYAGVLKCDVPVVVTVNSVLPAPYQNGADIIGLVGDSLTAAKVAGAPRKCP